MSRSVKTSVGGIRSLCVSGFGGAVDRHRSEQPRRDQVLRLQGQIGARAGLLPGIQQIPHETVVPEVGHFDLEDVPARSQSIGYIRLKGLLPKNAEVPAVETHFRDFPQRSEVQEEGSILSRQLFADLEFRRIARLPGKIPDSGIFGSRPADQVVP